MYLQGWGILQIKEDVGKGKKGQKLMFHSNIYG